MDATERPHSEKTVEEEVKPPISGCAANDTILGYFTLLREK